MARRRKRRRRGLGESCTVGEIASKVTDIRATEKPAKKFRPLFDATLKRAVDAARKGHCMQANLELRNARRVAGY